MKKSIRKITSILMIILLAVTAVSLAACGKNNVETPQNIVSDNIDQSPTEDDSEEPTEPVVIDTAEDEIEGVKYEFYSDGTLIASGKGCADSGKSSWKDQIKKVILEDGITDMILGGCENLTEVVIPGSVQIIRDGALSGCPNLTKVSIPESVFRIGEGAFVGCKNLAEIELPDTLVSVGEDAFKGTALEVENIDGVVYVGNVACGYTNIQGSVTLREGTRIIADEAFNSLDSITSVTIPDSAVGIGTFAFDACSNLSEINIPDSVYSIGKCAFDRTKWFYNQPDGLVYAGKVAYRVLNSYDSLDVVLEEGTVGIADYAFDGYYFSTFTLPAGLKWIGDNAGIDCHKQEELVIPDGVTHIGMNAISAPNIILPASVTSIRGSYSTTIIAPKGSYAESYALENNILYKER